MFNSYSGFKSATQKLHGAIKKNPKMGVAQLRETLVAATPIGNTAALKSHFSDSLAIAPAAPAQVAAAQIFVVVKKRDERLYSPTFSSYPEALKHIRTELKDALDDADMLVDYYDHICKKRPAKVEDAFEEVFAMIDAMNETQLRKFYAWFYQEQSPMLQINQSSLNIYGSAEHSSTKEASINILLNFPAAVIAHRLNELQLANVYASKIGIINIKSGKPMSSPELHTILANFVSTLSDHEACDKLRVPAQYSIEVSNIKYDTEDADIKLPSEISLTRTVDQVQKMAELMCIENLSDQSVYDMMSMEAMEAIHANSEFPVLSFEAKVLHCEGRKVTPVINTNFVNMPDRIPVEQIIIAIRSEEWGDVRSYLDLYDIALQSNAQAYSQVLFALDEQSRLVIFTRDGDSDWSYEEK